MSPSVSPPDLDADHPPYAGFADAAISLALDESYGSAAVGVLDRARADLVGDVDSDFATLAANAGADGPARELLALLVACEIDPVRAARIGVLTGSARPSRITLGVAARLLGSLSASTQAAGPGSALRRAALVHTEHLGPWATTEIVLAPGVVWALTGDAAADSDLPVDATSIDTDDTDNYTGTGTGTDQVASGTHGREVVLVVSGPDRTRRRRLALQRSLGRRFLVSSAPETEAGWAALVREATITGRNLVIELAGSLPAAGRRWIERATHLTWAITSADELVVRDLPQRARVEVTAGHEPVSDAEWAATFGSDVPRSHRLTAEQAELVASVYPTVGDDIDVAVRRLLAGPLGALARRTRPTKQWSDLVLSEAKLAQLRMIVARYRHADLVLDDWGLAGASGRGIVSLFTGPSGTGKTLAAEVVASALGLDLYRVDLSSVVSKYIGETEQNLEKLFAAASAGSSVLFFDEADSLFGKRSEVKDGRDRYANLEVSYLLQRLESYDGVVVLATNLPKNIDDAFLRRIHVVVDFPVPAPAERRAIWQRHLAVGIPHDDLDLDLLANRYELTGGVIRNAVVSAAFRAADEDSAVGMPHLMAALVTEYNKLGRLIREEDFSG